MHRCTNCLRKILTLTLTLSLPLALLSCGTPTPIPNPPLVLGEKYLADLDYEQALLQFDQAITIEPKNPRGYLGKADALLHIDRQSDAVTTLANGAKATSGNIRTALKATQAEVAKSPVDGYIGLSSAYEKLGWKEIALLLLRRVCEEMPEESRLRDALESIVEDGAHVNQRSGNIDSEPIEDGLQYRWGLPNGDWMNLLYVYYVGTIHDGGIRVLNGNEANRIEQLWGENPNNFAPMSDLIRNITKSGKYVFEVGIYTGGEFVSIESKKLDAFITVEQRHVGYKIRVEPNIDNLYYDVYLEGSFRAGSVYNIDFSYDEQNWVAAHELREDTNALLITNDNCKVLKSKYDSFVLNRLQEISAMQYSDGSATLTITLP